MAEFRLIIDAFLEDNNFSVEEFIQWIGTSNINQVDTKAFPNQFKVLRFSPEYWDAVRKEFSLLLLNFLRDDSFTILRSSQSLNQTPLKKPSFPEKYEYTSPAKRLRPQHNKANKTQDCNAQFQKPKSPPRRHSRESNNAPAVEHIKQRSSKLNKTPLFSESSSQNGALMPEERIDIESLPYLHRVPFSSTPNISKLEKRMGNQSNDKSVGLQIEDKPSLEFPSHFQPLSSSSARFDSTQNCTVPTIEVHRQNREKTTSRRSLDSQINACQNSNTPSGTRDKHNSQSDSGRNRKNSGGGKTTRSSESSNQTPHCRNFADFLPAQGIAVKKKGKNKNRKSDSAATMEKKIDEESELVPSALDMELDPKPNIGPNERVSHIKEATSDKSTLNSNIGNSADVENGEIAHRMNKVSLHDNDAHLMAKPDFSKIAGNLKKNESHIKQIVAFEEPILEKVTNKPQLDKLVTIYCHCITKLLVPNVLVELNHLLLLLTVKDVRDTSNRQFENASYFSSVHNCVYFAVHTLSRLQKYLLFGFQNLLQELKKIPRMEAFCPGINKELDHLIYITNQAPKKHGDRSSGILDALSGGGESVPFQLETDGRENFPDDKTFNDAKRQRDQFSTILQQWKLNHPKDFSSSRRNDTFKTMNYTMPVHGKYTKHGGGKNKILLKPSSPLEEHWFDEMCELLAVTNPVNLQRLATLFQAQLLLDSLNDLKNNEKPMLDLEDEQLIQEQLKKDPSKLEKLMNRVAPSSSIESTSAPEFPQSQEFYRDFLKFMGGNFCFIEHLKNGLVSSILELNDKTLNITKNRDSILLDNDDQERVENEFHVSLVKLRILAKFLGFIDAMPYKNLTTYKVTHREKGLETQVKQRKNYIPSIDLCEIVKNSLIQQRLVLTIPWIVEYCAIQDYVTMKLPYFEKLFDLMVQIYKDQLKPNTHDIHSVNENKRPQAAVKRNMLNDSLSLEFTEQNDSSLNIPSERVPSMNKFNAFFLCINLGWFFENKNFPRESFIKEPNFKELGFEASITQNQGKQSQKGTGMDYLIDIRPGIVKLCCPYISELKVVLYEFWSGFKAEKKDNISLSERFTNKRRASLDMIPKQPAEERDIQKELEEQFLRNSFLSQSTKDTINLVAERVASNFARIVEKKIVPEEKDLAKKYIRDLHCILNMTNLSNKNKDYLANFEIEGTPNQSKKVGEEEIQSQIDQLSSDSFERVIKEAYKVLKTETDLNCETSLMALLPSDMKGELKKACIDITRSKASRMGKEYINDPKRGPTKSFFLSEYSEFNQNLIIRSDKSPTNDMDNMSSLNLNSLKFENLKQVEENDASWALMGKLKRFVWGVMRNESPTGDDKNVQGYITQLLNDIKVALKSDFEMNMKENLERAQQNPFCLQPKQIPQYGCADLKKVFHGFDSLTVDLAIVLCSYMPTHFKAEIQDLFTSFWKWRQTPLLLDNAKPALQLPSTELLTIISHRNLMILSEGPCQMETWNRLEAFLGRLLKEKLIFPLILEEQLLSILRPSGKTEVDLDISNAALKRFASCLQGVVDSWRKCSLDEAEDFSQILEWLIWFVQQPEDLSSDNEFDNLDDFPILR